MDIIRTFAPILSLALFVAYSVVATVSTGVWMAEASPMLVVAIALLVWRGAQDERRQVS